MEYAPDASPDKRCYRVNCDKAERELSEYRPVWTAKKGAQELHEAYKRVGLTLEQFEGPKYQRIGHLKQLLASGVMGTDLRRQPALAMATA